MGKHERSIENQAIAMGWSPLLDLTADQFVAGQKVFEEIRRGVKDLSQDQKTAAEKLIAGMGCIGTNVGGKK